MEAALARVIWILVALAVLFVVYLMATTPEGTAPVMGTTSVPAAR